MTLKEQIEKMFKDVPKSKSKKSIMDEIMENLTDKVDDLVLNGMEENHAINLALEEFGDISELKDVIVEQEFTRHYKSSIAKKKLEFSCLGSLLIISSINVLDWLYLPSNIYMLVPSILVLWWPITMFYVWRRSKYIK